MKDDSIKGATLRTLCAADASRDPLSFVGDISQLAGISRLRAVEGMSKGCDLVHCYTGSGLEFTINCDRAMDIVAARYKGLSLAWISPVGISSSHHYQNSGTDWLRGFGGGLLTTCGLRQVGAPCEDEGERLGLHGRISSLPADKISLQESAVDGDFQMRVSGTMREASVFGENLIMTRTITSYLGQSRIEMSDTVTNLGRRSSEHMQLYHFNLGYPLISPDARLYISAEATKPRDEEAERGLSTYDSFSEPVDSFPEQVFYHSVPSDVKRNSVRVVQPCSELNGKLTFVLEYETETLPHLIQWKVQEKGTYVLGLEPANCLVEGRAKERAALRLQTLEPGETRRFSLSVEVREE